MPQPRPRRRASDVLREMETRAANPKGPEAAIAAGAIGYGAGGPAWLDQFRSKRSPVPTELVEQYKAFSYACMQLNFQGVVDTPLRLYCKTGPRDRSPRRDVVPVPVHRRNYLAKHRSIANILNGASDVHEVVEHDYLVALDQPNPYFDGSLFLAYLAACLDCVGRFCFFPVRPDNSWASKEWWPLQPQYVLPMKGAGGTILSKYAYFGQSFAPDELETGRFLSMRDPYLSGMPPMQAAYEQLGLVNYYTAVVEDTLKNGARPSGMVGPKDASAPWSPDVRDRVEADVNNKFGNGRQGFIWVVDGTFDFKTFTYPPGDLASLAITKDARLLIANCFGTPISLMQNEDSNRAVAEAGEYQHQKRAIRPRCTTIASALTQMARRVDPRLFFCFDNPVEADEERRAKVFDIKIKNGSKCINEVRADDGDPPVPWGNEPWFAGTLVQPSKVDERFALAQKQAEAKEKAKEVAPPTETEEGKKEKDAGEEADRGLVEMVTRMLERVEGKLDGDEKRDRRARRARRDARLRSEALARPAQDGPARAGGWAADGRSAQDRAGEVVRRPTERGAGDDPVDRDRATGDVPADGQLRRPDADGDDADDLGLLAGVGGGHDGETGGEDRPRNERLEGDEPPPSRDGPEVDAELLPGDERDDEDEA